MKTILIIFAAILALVVISTWMHPVLSMTIVVGATMWTILASCYGMEQEEEEKQVRS